MARWVVSAKRADFQAIAAKYGIDPVTARLIRNRDIINDEDIRQYLEGTLDDLPSPHLLKDADRAAEILEQKITEGKKIRILGDYDIDGVSATFILKKSLDHAGAAVDWYIPDRVLDGYGIHDHLIDRAIEDRVDTIITCDNGIAAFSEIARAKKAGITVIVTDHHEVPYEEADGNRKYIVPPADAVVNPKQIDCLYPNSGICGAVVALKTMQVLYDRMGLDKQVLDRLTEVAAIATVGDIMELQGENRILVREGLKRLPRTENKGLRSLLRVCGLEDSRITAYHIGFVLGPCINASGRLDTAARSLALLDADTSDEAEKLAGDLFNMNASRKALTEEGTELAIQMVEEKGLLKNKVLVIFLPECHESLAGIIAGRIREKYYRPVFILTRGQDSAKGSGRSIEGYSMYDEMTKCSDLFLQFGGHAMAAGLSIDVDKIGEFRRRINEQCALTEELLTPKTVIDAAVPLGYLSRKLIQEIGMLEPFGKGNTRPVFARKNLRALWPRIVGKNRNVVKMKLEEPDGFTIDAVYFGDALAFMEAVQEGSPLAVTYYPEINSYRGAESIQVIITDFVVNNDKK